MLMDFARKHLPDKFFLEDDNRISLRNAISREMLVNTLIHREMTSSFIAKFIIEENRMYVENASRSSGDALITPDNLEPNPKNPIIAAFFRNIGHSDQLGSGVRKLFKYTKLYSGQEPELIEGDIFRIIVPLNDKYSFDYELGRLTTDKTTDKINANRKKDIRSDSDKSEYNTGTVGEICWNYDRWYSLCHKKSKIEGSFGQNRITKKGKLDNFVVTISYYP